jgi:hypothetical protein
MTCKTSQMSKLQPEGLRDASPGRSGRPHPAAESGKSSDSERVGGNAAWSWMWQVDGHDSATLSGSDDVLHHTQGVGRQGSLTLGWAPAPLQGAAAESISVAPNPPHVHLPKMISPAEHSPTRRANHNLLGINWNDRRKKQKFGSQASCASLPPSASRRTAPRCTAYPGPTWLNPLRPLLLCPSAINRKRPCGDR